MEKLHIQPSELDMLPFYEYEYTLEIYNDIIKERNSEDEKEQAAMEDKYNVRDMQRQAQRNLSSYKTPNIPKITMPKF